MADPKDDDEDIAEELALGAAGAGTDPQTATAFLRAKTRLLQEQTRQLRVGHFREWLYASAEIVLGIIILMIFFGIASAVWSAAHDNGLVIESFSVPPDFQSRGLSGQVVASQLLDRLAAMQNETNSSRAPSSYTNDWGKDIKVQIPDTGVSIGELNSYLRNWLGSATHISGDIYRDGANVTVTTRVGSVAISASGPQADFGKLLQKVAEGVYRQTQPYRYAVYLESTNREKEAEAAYLRLIQNGSQQDKAWAYIGLSTIYQGRNEYPKSLAVLHTALSVQPDFVMSYVNIAGENGNLQHDEAAYQALRKVTELIGRGERSGMSDAALASTDALSMANANQNVGDYQQVLVDIKKAVNLPDPSGQIENTRDNEIMTYGFLHDGEAARDTLASMPAPADNNARINRQASMLVVQSILEDWNRVLATGDVLDASLAKFGSVGIVFRTRVAAALKAQAEAGLGNFQAADAIIAKTPLDCDLCVRMRGRVGGMEHKWDDAAHWFAMLSARSPSIPFADSDWGSMLLAKRDPDAAIAKFKSAHEKGPHYADPLEGWGEALMMKNRSDEALAEFAEAVKFAPNWGRLHLKWGEALLYTSDKQKAKAEFARAAKLDLTAAERRELTRAAH
ncbi:MAG: tetratricopeptide repeat protein [Rhizomicrobium sp.]